MFLVWALRTDEDALICDFAETYHVTDYRALPPKTAAALCAGLPRGSRLIRRASGSKLTLTENLLARIVDGINALIWQRSKDGAKGRNYPASILEALTKENNDTQPVKTFRTGAEFEAALSRLMET